MSDLRKVRITDVEDIKVGKFVAYVAVPAKDGSKALLRRGFIRSINGEVARIGDYLVKIDVDVIKYFLIK